MFTFGFLVLDSFELPFHLLGRGIIYINELKHMLITLAEYMK